MACVSLQDIAPVLGLKQKLPSTTKEQVMINCIIEEPDGSKSAWTQLRFGDMLGKNEAWLRDLLHTHPELIPLHELDPAYGPLVPLCTELPVKAGRVDNVFIDPRGRLTLVECKLWNNPEARRKVVAQILDYAKELGSWSANDLSAKVASRRELNGQTLFDLVRASHPAIQECDFYDGVARSLREGRFQLLVAGDGIHEEVQGIADLINKNATSAFSFGLFQVELFKGPSGALMVQPRAIARTKLIERTVIVVQKDGQLHLESDDSTSETNERPSNLSPAQKAHASSAEWWEPVLNTALQNQDQESFRYYWPHNIRASLPWPSTWITAYRTTAGARPMVGIFLGGREDPLAELLRFLENDWDVLREVLPEGTEFTFGQKLYVAKPLASFIDEDAARSWLVKAINMFVNEIRPRAVELVGK